MLAFTAWYATFWKCKDAWETSARLHCKPLDRAIQSNKATQRTDWTTREHFIQIWIYSVLSGFDKLSSFRSRALWFIDYWISWDSLSLVPRSDVCALWRALYGVVFSWGWFFIFLLVRGVLHLDFDAHIFLRIVLMNIYIPCHIHSLQLPWSWAFRTHHHQLHRWMSHNGPVRDVRRNWILDCKTSPLDKM